uniref:Ig-like domain-containing protein n=1 Tax=Poecilia mexicana TaxID=48701 RepID=A0A3B3Y2N1_9TELE
MYFYTLCCYICLCIFCVDMNPAKILIRQRTISEGSDLYVTCSIFGQKKYPSFYVYLLKDGQGFQKLELRKNVDDVLFTISNVHLNHSGNYSCLYSTTNYNPSHVERKGQDIVETLVIREYFLFLLIPHATAFISYFLQLFVQAMVSLRLTALPVGRREKLTDNDRMQSKYNT